MKNLLINSAFTFLFVLGISFACFGFIKDVSWAMFVGGGTIGFWHSILLDYIRSMKNG